jgi:AraC-like DNA-binding protein
MTAVDEHFDVTVGHVGFPTISWKAIPDGEISVALITAAPPGSRWCGIDLEPGNVLLYGTSAEHAARNVPGLSFTYVTLQQHQLEIHAEQLKVGITTTAPGEVQRLRRSPLTRSIESSFLRYRDIAVNDMSPTAADADDLLTALAHGMVDTDGADRIGSGKRIDSRNIVHTCIEYADSIGRVPSLSELCLLAHVSERRLRQAFADEFDLPPTRVFRAWAMAEAHRRLAHPGQTVETVTEVAVNLGFDHLGRFAGQYKEIFGYSPSATRNP